ncbi:ABC transporter permease/M1 family aminopeptidase [Neolewinella antarctica]|uniref:ABC-type transport system involved in multi-copper enzyme maturation permease subunit n=1 Tax=Neolewinella antarctica TaxID=442734 RepID=A0ABX0XFG2_9BACT|nr:M1 family aminopeptidase [Neolewinella antarctica]NJC28058.1 ABC-type transport system involved in multi-copper enzyme maturation permease subunit [Neolewinella antarctica]
MFLEIFRFELSYRLRRPATWAYFGLLLIFGAFLAVAGGGGGGGSEKAFVNSAASVSGTLITFSIFGIMIAAAVMGVPVYRDVEHKVQHYYFTYPITERGYLLGRYAGSLVWLLFISLGLHVGLILGYLLGPALGYEEAARFGPLNLWHYVQPTLLFYWPNLILAGTLFFALVALSRKVIISYVGGVLLFIGYLVSLTLSADIENKFWTDILDPFALGTFGNITKYWTPVEQNVLTAPLSENLLINRLIWGGLAAVLLLFTLFRFDFQRFLSGRGRRSKVKPEGPGMVATPVVEKARLPIPQLQFSGGLFLRQAFRQGWIEFRSILRSPYFLAMIVGGILFLFLDGFLGNRIYGTPTLPTTYSLLEAKNGTYVIFAFIILIFFTGEVVHRDRSVGFDQIADALPVPNWVTYAGKFMAMCLVSVFLATMVMVVGVLSQTFQGFFDYQFGTYLTDLYLFELPRYLQLAMLAFFVHIMVNKKFMGHVISIGVWVLLFGLNDVADINYNLLLYNYRPGYVISDMNGFGHFYASNNAFNLYWLLLGSILLLIGNYFWARGTEDSFRTRLRVARQRITRSNLAVLALLTVLWITTGSFIYHNVSVQNTYTTVKEGEQFRADYEKKYSHYLGIDQPKITDIVVHADLFPEDRRAHLEANVRLVNRTGAPIDSLHLSPGVNDERTITALRYNGKTLEPSLNDKKFGYRIYALPAPLDSGQTATLDMVVDVAYEGFPNEGFGSDVVANGTFLNGSVFSGFAYSGGGELESDLDRKKYGLEPKDYVSPPTSDLRARHTMLFNGDADYVTYEATVSTAPDQIALSPGYLQRSWEEDGRKYYHYKMEGKMDAFFNFSSARYAVARDTWRGDNGDTVAIEIYHHPTHDRNLDRFIDGVRASMDYYSRHFSPYQDRQMRILEFPRYANFAQSFPNTVPYSEGFGWNADFSDPDDTDYVFNVTAHEVAHQWWGHQITPSNTRGANQISESMAEYAALMVLRETYGDAVVPKFLKYEVDRYLSGRAGESKFEKTLLDNDTQSYVWYRKGGSILFALQDYIGEDTLNAAFARFLDDFAFQPPPYATTEDWYGYIQEATPDSLRYFLEDSFEGIVLYENRARKAVVTERPDGRFDVTLTFDSDKVRYDGNGTELERPTRRNLIEIGVFAEDGTNEDGMTEKKPLFVEKRWITPGAGQTVTVTVDERPVKAGVDPYSKLIDRVPDDNLVVVE